MPFLRIKNGSLVLVSKAVIPTDLKWLFLSRCQNLDLHFVRKRAFNSADINFEFSKFALLDLPDFTDSVNGSNTIDFELNLKEQSGAAYNANMPNVDFAQTFQNYALNLEELLLKDDDYDPILLQSDSEKIFFKWLSSLGVKTLLRLPLQLIPNRCLSMLRLTFTILNLELITFPVSVI